MKNFLKNWSKQGIADFLFLFHSDQMAMYHDVIDYLRDKTNHSWIWMPDSYINNMGSIFSLGLMAIMDKFNIKKDDAIMIFGDNATFLLPLNKIKVHLENEKIKNISAWTSIYKLFHQVDPTKIRFYTPLGVATVVTIFKAEIFRNGLGFDSNLPVMEDSDLDFQIINKYGNKCRRIITDFRYTKRRHQEGGFNNLLKRNKDYMESVASYFNNKWEGNYCTIFKNEHGIYSHRRKYQKFIKDQNAKKV